MQNKRERAGFFSQSPDKNAMGAKPDRFFSPSPLHVAVAAKFGKGLCAYLTHKGSYLAYRGPHAGPGALLAGAGTMGIGLLLGVAAHELGQNPHVKEWVDKHIHTPKGL